MSQLIKLATPGKLEKQNERSWNLFLSDTKAFLWKNGEQSLFWKLIVFCGFKFFSCFSGGSLSEKPYWIKYNN